MKYIYRFHQTDKEDLPVIGKKAVTLSNLARTGIPLVEGFVISKEAFDAFLRENNLKTKIDHYLNTIDHRHPDSILQASSRIKQMIQNSTFPEKLADELFSAYHGLTSPLKNASIVIHNSHIDENSPDNSNSVLTGDTNLLLKLKELWSSYFTNEYLHSLKDFPNSFPKAGAVIIQSVVNPDVTGVMYTLNPTTQDNRQIIIEAIYGQYDLLKNGSVTPDRYVLDKENLYISQISSSYQSVINKHTDSGLKEVLLSKREGKKQKLNSSQIQYLSEIGKKIEQIFASPQEITWALKDNKFMILDTHTFNYPINKNTKIEKSDNDLKNSLLATGIPSSGGIATNNTRLINNVSDAKQINQGEIVILKEFKSDFRPYLKKSGGIVSETGGSVSDIAYFARHLGIPCIMGVNNSFKIFRLPQIVTVNGITGQIKKPFISQSKQNNKNLSYKTATKVYLNVVSKSSIKDSDIASSDGVGLLPSEKIISSIGIHPKKMINEGKESEFIQKLAKEIESYCLAFSPNPVIYRASNMTSKEYKALIGGKEIEPNEENPIMGFRGAYRFLRETDVFLLELEAIKIIRNKMNLRNLWFMVPYVRNIKELMDIKKIISSAGLYRSPSFKLFMMVEVPSNVLLIDKFIQCGIDGVMVGSEDLTMLLLGTDHNNSEVSKEYSDGDEAVHVAIEHVVKESRKNNIESILHFNSPSVSEEFLEKLVHWGVSGVSVTPNNLNTTRSVVAKAEKKLIS